MLLEKKTVFTVSGLRDLYKKHVQDAVLAIYGLENQTEIHYAMPVRTMLLDAVDYSKQCKTISHEHRIHIFQIRDCGQYSFSHPDNQDFFTLISEFYTQKKRFNFNDFKENHPTMSVHWETAAAIKKITHQLKSMNIPIQVISKALMESFHLSEDELKKYL